MSDQVQPHLAFEIGHILFVDIVGYSKLLANGQVDAGEELNRIVRTSERVRAAEATDKLLCLPSGDGMAIVFFDSPESPPQCAMEISQTLRTGRRLRIRMGIHSGP